MNGPDKPRFTEKKKRFGKIYRDLTTFNSISHVKHEISRKKARFVLKFQTFYWFHSEKFYICSGHFSKKVSFIFKNFTFISDHLHLILGRRLYHQSDKYLDMAQILQLQLVCFKLSELSHFTSNTYTWTIHSFALGPYSRYIQATCIGHGTISLTSSTSNTTVCNTSYFAMYGTQPAIGGISHTLRQSVFYLAGPNESYRTKLKRSEVLFKC